MSIQISIQHCSLGRTGNGNYIARMQICKNNELPSYLGYGDNKEQALQRALAFVLNDLGGEYSIGVNGDTITFDPSYNEMDNWDSDTE